MNKRYTITLQRQKEYQNIVKPKSAKNPNKEYAPEDSTIGSLVVRDNEKGEDIFKCFVVENIGPSTDTPKQDKRIVARLKLNSLSSVGCFFIQITHDNRKTKANNKIHACHYTNHHKNLTKILELRKQNLRLISKFRDLKSCQK